MVTLTYTAPGRTDWRCTRAGVYIQVADLPVLDAEAGWRTCGEKKRGLQRLWDRKNLQVMYKVLYMGATSHPGSRVSECSQDKGQSEAGFCTPSLTFHWNSEFQVFLRESPSSWELNIPPFSLGAMLVSREWEGCIQRGCAPVSSVDFGLTYWNGMAPGLVKGALVFYPRGISSRIY